MLVVFPLGLLATSVCFDIASLLFVVSFISRDTEYDPELGNMVWSFAGAGLALVTAWLGGELVDRLGVGVDDDDAGLNASSSLGEQAHPHRPATGK